MGSQTNINTDTGDSMEAHFTVRDKPQNFADWVNSYGMAKQADFVPQTLWHLVDGRWIEHPVGNAGLIRFTVDVVEPELLDVRAVTRWKWDNNVGQWLTENDELNAYFAELVRAIRSKWEPVEVTVPELYDQSYRRIKAGEERIKVFRSFFLPNLPDGEKPRDASHEADIHNNFNAAMAYRSKKARQRKR